MANQNFKVKNGLEVGTGVTISAGIITAISFIGNASNAIYAITAGVSTYSGISGVSTFSEYSNTSGVSTFSNYSDTSGVSTFSGYSNTSGVSTFSGYSNTSGVSTFSTYSNTSGVSTYASSAGIATTTTNIPNLTGDVISNGTATSIASGVIINSDISASASIEVSKLSASTISGVTLGNNLNTLTLNTSGTGLSGSTTYNGSGSTTFTVTSNATSANTGSTIVSRDSSGNFSAGTVTATGGTFTGQIQSTQANSTSTGGGQIYLNGSTGNRIDFNSNGVAAPTFTTRSAGTKIVLYPQLDASNADYAFGIESSTLWSSVPTTSQQFKWYAGTTNVATLTGAGNLSVTGTVSGTNITSAGNVSGNAATATNISNTGTVTLASATEANSIYITQPSYTTDQPVKLLNFDWYSNLWSLGNIRSGATPSSGFGVYYTASGGSRSEISRFTTSGLSVTGSISATTVNDSSGNVRAVPQNSQTSAYILAASDVGKHISITTGGVTVNSGIFSAGDAISIYNNSGSNQTITQGGSVTMYLAGTATTGNRTLAQRGVATVLCVGTNTFVISGAGLT